MESPQKGPSERGGGARTLVALCAAAVLLAAAGIIPAHLPNPRHPRECAVHKEFARVSAAALTANVLSSAWKFRSATVKEADSCYKVFSSGRCTFRFLLLVASCFDFWFYTHNHHNGTPMAFTAVAVTSLQEEPEPMRSELLLKVSPFSHLLLV